MKPYAQKIFSITLLILTVGMPFFSSAAEGSAEFDLNSPQFQEILGEAIVQQTIGQLDESSSAETSPTSYLQRLFIFMLGLVGLSSFIMITIGGIQYASSGGNPSGIGAAKSKIWNALFGLILAGSSYLILRAINPDFLRLNILPPQPIQQTAPSQQTPAQTSSGFGEQNIPQGINPTVQGQQPGAQAIPFGTPPRGGTPPAGLRENAREASQLP